jgi:hypothetical protein
MQLRKEFEARQRFPQGIVGSINEVDKNFVGTYPAVGAHSHSTYFACHHKLYKYIYSMKCGV